MVDSNHIDCWVVGFLDKKCQKLFKIRGVSLCIIVENKCDRDDIKKVYMLLFTHIVEVLEELRFAGQLFMPFKMIYYLFREGV